jgi:hypothetical protein
MMPFDAYKQYLSLKNHFTKDKYDYHKYCGKSRATVQSFYKRKDRFWFEKFSRQKTDQEVIDFFVSNFLSYVFKQEVENILAGNDFDSIFSSKSGHPIILKKYLGGDISIETLVILDRVLGFRKEYDDNLQDPVWETVSMRMKKYSPFLNIDVQRYKKILKGVVLGEV